MQLEIDDVPPLTNSPHRQCLRCKRQDSKLMQCSKCQKVDQQALYCSRDCQVADFGEHKRTCGRQARNLAAIVPCFKHSAALQNQLACLATLSDTQAGTRVSYLYYPSSPLTTLPPPDPQPIVLSPAARPVFDRVFRQANSTRNSTSINLVFSLLSDAVLAAPVNGSEDRLIEQLSEEYEVDLNKMLEDEQNPTEDELTAAIGGEEGLGDLLQWQRAEADGSRV
ncbi:hypothetical protein ACM66B_005571 [Microbotryomycetes sp. NB124-2]